MKKLFVIMLMVSAVTLTGCTIKKKPVVLEDNMGKTQVQQESVTTDIQVNNDTTMVGTGSTGEAMMKKDDSMMQKEAAMMKKEDTMMKKDEQTMQQNTISKGAYESYSADAVKQHLAAGKKVMLFFYAARCPSCRSLDKQLTSQTAQLPDNSVVMKVNYDTEGDLKKTYGVTSQHTLVYIDKNMKILFKQSGGDIDSVVSILK